MDCIFCKIVAGEIPCTKVYEDEHVLAFNDVNPQSPKHVLIVPKRHMANILEADGETAVQILEAIKKVVNILGIDQKGFRVISNCGHDGAQSVNHLHVHVLGGTKLTEKMA